GCGAVAAPEWLDAVAAAPLERGIARAGQPLRCLELLRAGARLHRPRLGGGPRGAPQRRGEAHAGGGSPRRTSRFRAAPRREAIRAAARVGAISRSRVAQRVRPRAPVRRVPGGAPRLAARLGPLPGAARPAAQELARLGSATARSRAAGAGPRSGGAA